LRISVKKIVLGDVNGTTTGLPKQLTKYVRQENDKFDEKCCGALEWWAIVLIVLDELVVIGAVAVGVILYLRKKKANAGWAGAAGQMNANNAAAGAYDQPGNVSGGQTESAAGAEGTLGEGAESQQQLGTA
jgi:hypothetical protein